MKLRSTVVVFAIALTGCGRAAHHGAIMRTLPTSTQSATTTAPSPSATPLQAEATSAAAGDIPDNQVFLSYSNPTYSMKYPEGWAQTGSGAHVTFRNMNNIVRVVLGDSSATQSKIAGAKVTTRPTAMALPAGRAVKEVYRTVSAPNPVTGKRITLTVDRYTITGKRGKQAIVDLGTPVGVDNVDAYRMMIESFRWR